MKQARKSAYSSNKHLLFQTGSILVLFSIALVLVVGLSPLVLQAQEPAKQDTVFLYEVRTDTIYALGEISIRGEKTDRRSPVSTQKINLAALEQADTRSASGVLRLVPGAVVQTNSRGEDLIYLRSAGERQTGVFFEGAPLMVPWDQRIDASFIPTSAIGSISVQKSTPSVLFGPNVMGGVINLLPRKLQSDGRYSEAYFERGRVNATQAGITTLVKQGERDVTISLGYLDREAYPISNKLDLPFSQSSSTERTNSDIQRFNALVRVESSFLRDGRFSLSLLHVEGSKGVAPEGHIDPIEDPNGIRYWRYPEWKNSMVVANADKPLRLFSDAVLKSTVWMSQFKQRLTDFTSQSYDVIDEREEDQNTNGGLRFGLISGLGPGRFQLSYFGSYSRHHKDRIGDSSSELNFSQLTNSLGTTYSQNIGRGLDLSVGLSADVLATPTTGDKPSRSAQSDLGFSMGLIWEKPLGVWSLDVGRRTRFPTLRELFGEALGRFIINPDLKAESSLSIEGGVARSFGSKFNAKLLGFARSTDNTISVLRFSEENGDFKRQRVNIEGSRLFGVEFLGEYYLSSRFNLSGHLTLMHARSFSDETASYDRFLEERPGILGTLNARIKLTNKISSTLEIVQTGRAHSLDEENKFVELDPYTNLNLRIGYVHYWSNFLSAELFARINNATDSVVIPQIGLAGEGRNVLFGLRVTF